MDFYDPRGVLTLVAIMGIVMGFIGLSRKESFIIWWIAGAAIALFIGNIFDHFRLAWIFSSIAEWGLMLFLIGSVVIAIALGLRDKFKNK